MVWNPFHSMEWVGGPKEVLELSRSLGRAISLLLLMAEGDGREQFSVSGLARQMGLSPSTVHRLLGVLKDHGLVAQDHVSLKYYLGPALISLGLRAGGYLNLKKAAQAVLQRLAEVTEADAYLTVADGDVGVFIDRAEGPHPLKIIESLGSRVPLHCGAMRKVLLAYRDEESIGRYLEKRLERLTAKTICDPEMLLSEIRAIREKGYAVSYSEYVEGGAGVGAPVRDVGGAVIASIGVIGPITRFGEDTLPFLAREVQRSAEQVSAAIGFQRRSEGRTEH